MLDEKLIRIGAGGGMAMVCDFFVVWGRGRTRGKKRENMLSHDGINGGG